MFYYFYVLKNKYGNEKLYYGYTSDLRRRVQEHKRKTDCALVYYEAFRSQKDAMKRERAIKCSGQARRWLRERIGSSLKG